MHIGSLLGETVATCFFLWGFVKLMAKPLDFSCDATETAKQDLCDATQIDLCWLISFRISCLFASFESGWMDFLRFDRSMITEDELVNAFKIFDKDFLAPSQLGWERCSADMVHRERAHRIWFNGVQWCLMVFNVPGQKWHHRCHWAPGCALQVGLFCESPAATQWNSVGSPGVVFFKLQIWSQ